MINMKADHGTVEGTTGGYGEEITEDCANIIATVVLGMCRNEGVTEDIIETVGVEKIVDIAAKAIETILEMIHSTDENPISILSLENAPDMD